MNAPSLVPAAPNAPATPPELSDEELARRIVSGEKELFELLMRRHNQRLFRVARGVVDSDLEAEDVLQDAWVRSYEHLAEFRGEAQLTTWLSKIALYEALARKRRARRFVGLASADRTPAEDPWMSGMSEVDEPEAATPNPEQAAWSGELRAALERAVGAMPSRYRAVFLMREVEGLSTAETAASLDLSLEAVKVRLHRARARLRDDLERRLGFAAHEAFSFAAERCDRVVAGVLARIG
ncbi:MAG TPA: RNA polymerase sigma factor [Thermoanaerobaculia bacterium]|nr:RNA polymerase sigma factor [Thermoanaerobaculia bacterium]